MQRSIQGEVDTILHYSYIDAAERRDSLLTLKTLCELDGKLAEVNSWLRSCRERADSGLPPLVDDDQSSERVFLLFKRKRPRFKFKNPFKNTFRRSLKP